MALPWAAGGVPLWGEDMQTCLRSGGEMPSCVRSGEEMPGCLRSGGEVQGCVLTRTLNNKRRVSAPQGHFIRSPWQRRGKIVPQK